MKRSITIFCTFFMAALTVFGQHSGNHLVGQHREQIMPSTLNKLYVSDSSFIIEANVLTNVIADSYVATFGVTESSKTLKEANAKVDEKIKKFISDLTKINIPKSDIYIDMTTQTQIYDYKVNENYSEQFVSGFQQQKNVVIKFKNIADLEKMIMIASDHEIYDLAKVDYLVSDISTIYQQLFQTAMEVINRKKGLYVQATNMKLKSSSQIYGESFYSLTPSQLYKSYTPNISSEYYDNNYNTKRKDLKKNTTYYYDHINYSNFDKVINPSITEPAVEYILTLQIKFNIEKIK